MAPKDTSNNSAFSLKDQLFNRTKVEYLGQLFQQSDSSFDSARFTRHVMKRLTKLGLKQRIVLIAEVLEKFLASDFRVAAKQIIAALPPPLDPTKTDDDFGDFIFAPLGEFLVRNGLSKTHLATSLKTLKEVTQRFSMEDAIRAFIDEFPEATLKTLSTWAADENYHVRRLVSEGTRPMLPWSKRLCIDNSIPMPLLDALHADQTRYVTRSVANHLNDVAKSNPKAVLDRLRQWQKQELQDKKELQWMSKHALRTLVKQGHPQALRFLGFRPNPRITVSNFVVEQEVVQRGDAVEFSFDVQADHDELLMIDYVLHFVKANGQLSPKVHKLKQVKIGKGDRMSISKRHVLRAKATTFTRYPGTHRLTLQINGKAYDDVEFELI